MNKFLSVKAMADRYGVSPSTIWRWTQKDRLPKPVHFDDSEHVWSVGAVSGAYDIETVALHEIGHIVGLAHSSVSGAVMAPTVSSNFTKRALTQDDIDGFLELYPEGGEDFYVIGSSVAIF